MEDFLTVNLDTEQHYRTEYNVVRRPTQDSGRGYSLTGHHEIMLPLLYAMILEASELERAIVEQGSGKPRDAVPWRKAKYGSLAISYHDAEVPWVELAKVYWQQRLAGLCAVASSRYTLVHRGGTRWKPRVHYFKRFLLRQRRDWLKHVVYGSRAIRTVRHEARL